MIPTRRDFLKASAATGSLVSWGWTVPAFLNRTAYAAPPSQRNGAKDTILVVVELTGGNDGLNTVIPFIVVAFGCQLDGFVKTTGHRVRLDDNDGFIKGRGFGVDAQ